ncbi:MAG: DUF1707 domain-containing protein [Solirubrobacteraceae bacterium]
MDDAEIRSSDAEREAAMARLRDAAGEGRLTFEELADRLQAAGTATTRGELETLTRDLPAAGPPAPAPAPPSAPAPVPPSAPGRSSVFGDVRGEGVWRVPASSRWFTVFGDVVLDLREARVRDAVVTVDASTVFGDIDLLVPEGIAVEVRSRTIFGDVRQDAGDSVDPNVPRVVLTGWTVFGDVRVRARRLRERLVDRWRARGG